MAHFAQLTRRGWIKITEDEFEGAGAACRDGAEIEVYALAWIQNEVLCISNGLHSPIEFDFEDSDDRRNTDDDGYDICSDAASTMDFWIHQKEDGHAEQIRVAGTLAAVGCYVAEIAGDRPLMLFCPYSASHFYMRALVARIGLSQCARRLGIDERTFTFYLADRDEIDGFAELPGAVPDSVRAALEALANE